MRTTYKGTRPAFLFGDKYVQSTGRQVDWDQIPDSYRQGAVAITAGANAAQNATSMTLTVPVGTTLAKGTVLDFGSGKFAKLAESVVGTGAEIASIDVEALVTAIVDLDVAYYGGTGPKFVKAGTIMAELSSGKIVPDALQTRTYSAARTAKATNTGNGVMTLATPAVLTGAKVGTYTVTIIEPGTDGGIFSVEDPDGVEVGQGAVASAFATQIGFTIADGSTDFVAGDSWTVVVTQTDGSACAGLILTDATQGSLTDSVTGYGVVIGGVVFENLLPDAVDGDLTAAQKAKLAAIGPGFVYEDYADNRA